MTSKDSGTGRKRGRHLVEGTGFESSDYSPHFPLVSSVDQGDFTDFNDSKDKTEMSNLKGDYGSIALLTFLYILQGIPLGLAGSIPMLLTSRHVNYKDQALFSFVYWPFSIKLLWAPLVDAIYIPWFGRRKTWLVPTQYMIGLFMLVLSYHVKDVMGDGDDEGRVNILLLTVVFFMLNSLAATQDIAVDGWALTMLSRRNVGWASTCNSVGQTAGYFLGNVLFLGLESADFCNKYLRSEPQKEGIVTLAGFLYFWGIIFFITTTLVMIIKRERMDPDVDPEMGILETYKILLNVIKLPSVLSYTVILLTSKVAFAATDSLTSLKLIESGFPKERLAIFAIPMIPIQIILPIVISKFTAGPRPMAVFLKSIPFRILLGVFYAGLVYLSQYAQIQPGEFALYFYFILLVCYALHQVFVYSMFVSQMAFHAKVSDPSIGGTYMTLLNTVANLGGNWPATLMLWLVDLITWKSCDGGVGDCYIKGDNTCKENGGSCVTTVDGYYIETCLCVMIGLLWLKWRSRRLKELDALDVSAWKCDY
ncbi:acetyl-coenzyme A transporter 1 [Patella vulgata]|uniref:acetyl-coenzyme A transporter 1 n=1 Tax=Patella vulgata TaxID=6465 RepID=UPI0021800BEC|nr:acetyl-coenzyme A transporter 1 [Patella vulgata]XP_050414538.1 acetyl-coenzyme A transporter 1 [Patella vulgata]XP_055958463.1 acetyl-coenzyme A transporter 1 [Patella vulgata]